MIKLLEHRFLSVQCCTVIMDGIRRICIKEGTTIQQDMLPENYIPESMQLFFDDELVHDSRPRDNQVLFSVLSSTSA